MTRRARGLWERVVAFENFHRAAYRTLRGKRGRVSAGDFFVDLEGELLRLRDELQSRTYRPGAYHAFWIRDPKPRLISAAPFRDRVVQHALVGVIEPVFERRFVHHSYACRRGKGTHRALAQFVAWARSSRYVLTMDVRKYFPSIDHTILKATVRRAIKDENVLWLCDRIIDEANDQEPVRQYFAGDRLFDPVERRHGIPIGNLTSQLFANLYLDPLDHFVTERLREGRYLRYMDDFCCFGDDKEALRAVRAAIREELAALRLRMNEGKSRLRRVQEGIGYLGFVVRPEHLRLNQRGVRRQRLRVRRLQRAFAAGAIEWPEVATSLRAWQAHAAHGTTGRLRRQVLATAVFCRPAAGGQATSMAACASAAGAGLGARTRGGTVTVSLDTGRRAMSRVRRERPIT